MIKNSEGRMKRMRDRSREMCLLQKGMCKYNRQQLSAQKIGTYAQGQRIQNPTEVRQKENPRE